MRSRTRTVATLAPVLVAVLAACASKAAAPPGDTAAPSKPAVAAASTAVAAASTAASTEASTAASTTVGAPAGSTGAAVAATADAAVAGDIPDNQAFVAVSSPTGATPPGAGYVISVPEGWARTTDGAATVFSDKFNTVRIETAAMAVAPTVASVTSGEVPAIASSATGYKAGKVVAATRKSGPVIVSTYQMTSAPNAVTSKTVTLDVERYEFWKNGTVAIVTLSSAAGSDNVDPWRAVTDGFAWR